MRRVGSIALGVGGLWLVLFHAAIFWRRIADASIAQPQVLARWFGAALILGVGLFLLRRCRGLHATIIFWLLVAMLHLGTPAEEPLATLAIPAALLVLAFSVAVRATNRTLIALFSPAAAWSPKLELGRQNPPRSPPTA